MKRCIIKDKTYRTYNKYSRYQGIPYYYNVTDNKYMYGISKHLSTETPFQLHVVRQGDTIDLLAYYYYNNPTYYWVICDFNRIQDPFSELEVGSKIKIPTFSTLEFE